MIIFHTVAAVACFIIGVIIISPKRAKKYSWLMPAFIWTLIIMILFMIAATVSHWYKLSVSERITFSGLAGLGLYMLYRSFEAKKHLNTTQVKEIYFDDVGFILISLFDGFSIVGLLDLGTPIWMIIAGAILAIVIGNYFKNIAKRRFASN
jgi:uncharacterized membrane protein YoaK (UPF0700 family)